MSEAHTNALLAALESQRNNALNGQVKTEAALSVALTKIKDLESELAKAREIPLPVVEEVTS